MNYLKRLSLLLAMSSLLTMFACAQAQTDGGRSLHNANGVVSSFGKNLWNHPSADSACKDKDPTNCPAAAKN